MMASGHYISEYNAGIGSKQYFFFTSGEVHKSTDKKICLCDDKMSEENAAFEA
jgi:hypothetical protein